MQALETTKLDEVLNLYGTITLFAPTDAAFQKYFQRNGISGVAQMQEYEIREMLYYHMYNTVYSSNAFTSGSLPEPTRLGKFIKMDVTKGIKSTVLNNSIKVDTMDITLTNGIVHVIDDVLEPPVQSMYDWLKEHSEYSIMLETFEKTGNDSILKNLALIGDTAIRWKTVFLESNRVLAEYNIISFDDLARKYSDSYYTSQRYTESYDSLNIFVRYHCMDRKFFLSDVSNDYFVSKSFGNWLLFGTTPGLSINRHTEREPDPVTGEINTVYKQVGMYVDQSNNITNNGIIHSIDKPLTIYDPEPVQLDLLFAGVPADRTVRVNGEMINLTDPSAFNQMNNDEAAQSAVWWLKWNGYMTGEITSGHPANVFNDYCVVIRSNTGEYSLEMTTKPIFKGRYQIYISYRRGTNPNYFAYFYWDDRQLGEMQDLTASRDAFVTDLNARTDWAIYRGVGIVDVPEMAAHRFKLTLPNPGTTYTAWYTLRFVPVK
jgi:uncharacterized surface protein with fasciclin (FAS1) repeats